MYDVMNVNAASSERKTNVADLSARDGVRASVRVAFIGNLAGAGYAGAKAAIEAGAIAELFLGSHEQGMARPGSDQDGGGPLLIYEYDVGASEVRSLGGRIVRRLRAEFRSIAVIRRLLRFDVIQSYTGSLFFLSSFAVLTFGVLRLRPFLAFATGSDLREVAASEPGRRGWIMRMFFRRAARTLVLNVDLMPVAEKLRLRHAGFSPFPIDTRKYEPRKVAKLYCEPDELLVFMPSHLDWGEGDPSKNRNSTKGNDRLIRAFARFIDGGNKGHLVLLDRGPDRHAARLLVGELAISEQVTFLPEMTKAQLIDHFNMADVIADQFDIGSFGMTGLEAMACGKPVLIFIDQSIAARCYRSLPPVLNAKSEDEILSALEKMKNADTRIQLGKSARDWILANHDSSIVGHQFLELYNEALSGLR